MTHFVGNLTLVFLFLSAVQGKKSVLFQEQAFFFDPAFFLQ